MIDVIIGLWTRAGEVDLPSLDTPVLGGLPLGWVLWAAVVIALGFGVCMVASRVQRTARYLDAIDVDRRPGEAARGARWALALIAPLAVGAPISAHQMTDGHPGTAYVLLCAAALLIALASSHIRAVQLEAETEHYGVRIRRMARRMDEMDRLVRAVRITAQRAVDQATSACDAVAEAATEKIARIDDTLVQPATDIGAAAGAAGGGAPTNARGGRRGRGHGRQRRG